MIKVIRCDCGYVVRGGTDDQVVEQGQRHARDAHGIDLTRDQVLDMAQPE